MNPRRQAILGAMGAGGGPGVAGRRRPLPGRRPRPGATPNILQEEGGEIVPPQPIGGGGQGMRPVVSGSPEATAMPGPGGGQRVGQASHLADRRAGIEQGFQAGFGKQLSRRVESGAIDPEQAEQTADERELLEKAFGPDWRIHAYGSRGLMQRTRQQVAEGNQDPNVQALLDQLMQNRVQALAAARKKVGRPVAQAEAL